MSFEEGRAYRRHKKGSIEQLVEVLTLLPAESQLHTDLTDTLIDILLDNFQHPPSSYLGGNVRYRAVQGIKRANGEEVGKAKGTSAKKSHSPSFAE